MEFLKRAPAGLEVDKQGVGHLASTIPVLEERVIVDKVEVDQGGYRVTKHVERQQHRIDEELREVRVDIERRAIGTYWEESELPLPRYEGATYVIPVVEEVLVTEKRLVLVEEVRITRTEEKHREVGQVELRKETVEVQRLAPGQSNAQHK